MLKTLVAAFLLLAMPLDAIPQAPPKGYKIAKEFKLDPAGDGVNGFLQLLADRRLKKRKNGILRMISLEGKMLFSKTLEKPGVDLEVFHSKTGDNTLFFLTEDWSIEFGSYNGPITFVVAIVGGIPIMLEARDEKGAHRKISLMRSLKTVWKTVANHGAVPQILKVSCRPDFETKPDEEMRFITTYSRFVQVAGEWKVFEKHSAGLWEDEGVFPPLKAFPKGNR
jgi:hypothetical protein